MQASPTNPGGRTTVKIQLGDGPSLQSRQGNDHYSEILLKT
ncbi:hypothetical protein RSSM_01514 [Rhodopirellula sallentina SM41]|uniref:Uncharacterized protein n=1 Tax=Rhodopirellula sallentina SM41 TaxID=1263870 RepID=M5U6H8_9BACT|nr:hypothetical protein RSSM_01514 [Rhodopirellula sallentina SM41]